MSPSQTAAFSAWMDRIYDGFVARVAEGRKMTVQQVNDIAKGHVWTGAQAKSLGLVDYIGGFPQAVDRAKALAGITGDRAAEARSPPRRTRSRRSRACSAAAPTARACSWPRLRAGAGSRRSRFD